MLRKRFTYSNIVATLALVFAMSGGALAAGKYLITSTKQIKPSVLASLKGKAGAAGAAGATGPAGTVGPAGAAGAQGPAGPQGPAGEPGAPGAEGKAGKNGTNGKNGEPWTAGGVLPSGKSETGVWSIGPTPAVGHESLVKTTISFLIPLEKSLEKANVHIFEGPTAPEHCTLNGTFLEAAPGNLCIRVDGSHTIFPSIMAEQIFGFDIETAEEGAGRTGVELAGSEIAENSLSVGTWAVTG
jgi:hypothetical protein